MDIKFSKDNNPKRDFLGYSYGTFVIRKSVLNAGKVVKTKMDRESNILKVFFDLQECPVKTKPVEFSFSVQIKDCTSFCSDCNGCECRNNGDSSLCYDSLNL